MDVDSLQDIQQELQEELQEELRLPFDTLTGKNHIKRAKNGF